MSKDQYKTILKKGDDIKIISGKEKGKTSSILKIDHKKGRAIIEGLNMVRKTLRKSREHQNGGIIDVEAPVHLSNMMYYCKKCNKAVRLGNRIIKDKKERYCKKCDTVI